MTISVPAKATPRSVTAYHETQKADDGSDVKGYMLRVGAEAVFLAEADADNLGRYFLFESEVTEDSNE